MNIGGMGAGSSVMGGAFMGTMHKREQEQAAKASGDSVDIGSLNVSSFGQRQQALQQTDSSTVSAGATAGSKATQAVSDRLGTLTSDDYTAAQSARHASSATNPQSPGAIKTNGVDITV